MTENLKEWLARKLLGACHSMLPHSSCVMQDARARWQFNNDWEQPSIEVEAKNFQPHPDYGPGEYDPRGAVPRGRDAVSRLGGMHGHY